MADNNIEEISSMDTSKTRAGKRKRKTGSTRKELNDFEAILDSQEEQMGHIDNKIDQIFQDDVMLILISRQERRTLCDSPEQESHVFSRGTCRSPRSDVQDNNFGEEKDRFSKYYETKPVENNENTESKLTGIFGSDASSTKNTDVVCVWS